MGVPAGGMIYMFNHIRFEGKREEMISGRRISGNKTHLCKWIG
jgi:hypothetical protein